MQQPSLSRALPMGVLGFLIGTAIVFVVRGLQSMNPLWDAGVGLIFGSLFAAGFFVMGIGAFDPRMSVHGEHAHDLPLEPETPFGLLSGLFWQIAALLVLLVVLLMAAARLGPALMITDENAASVLDVGSVPVNLFGQDIQMTTLTIFVIFVIILMVSLLVTAGIMARVFTFLAEGIAEAKRDKASGQASHPLPGQRALGRGAAALAQLLRGGSAVDGTRKNPRN
jgi:hypothetical protein